MIQVHVEQMRAFRASVAVGFKKGPASSRRKCIPRHRAECLVQTESSQAEADLLDSD